MASVQQTEVRAMLLQARNRRHPRLKEQLNNRSGATPGHAFILVGPDGVIRWRADYGEPPNFTMYVPNGTLLAELRSVEDG
jgi:hypothetical protein